MKSICMTAVFLVMVLLTACQGLAEKKNVQSNETTSSTLIKAIEYRPAEISGNIGRDGTRNRTLVAKEK